MPTEDIHKAARLMRDRANTCSRHEPWTFKQRIDNPSYTAHVSATGDAQWSGVADVIIGSAAEAHIASWHPIVALAVADWLDSVAGRWIIAKDVQHYSARQENQERALEVAHAYLGGAS